MITIPEITPIRLYNKIHRHTIEKNPPSSNVFRNAIILQFTIVPLLHDIDVTNEKIVYAQIQPTIIQEIINGLVIRIFLLRINISNPIPANMDTANVVRKNILDGIPVLKIGIGN